MSRVWFTMLSSLSIKKRGFYIIFMDILGLLVHISCLDFFKHPVLHLKRQVRVVPQEGNEVIVTLWTY